MRLPKRLRSFPAYGRSAAFLQESRNGEECILLQPYVRISYPQVRETPSASLCIRRASHIHIIKYRSPFRSILRVRIAILFRRRSKPQPQEFRPSNRFQSSSNCQEGEDDDLYGSAGA